MSDSDARTGTLAGVALRALLLISFLVAGMVLADHQHLDYAAVLLLQFGVGLTVCTVFRPQWFWTLWKVALLRQLVGDRVTIAIYLVVGTWAVCAGVVREHMWKQDIGLCRAAYAAAHGLAEVRAVDALIPRNTVPASLRIVPYDPTSCQRHYDHGDLG